MGDIGASRTTTLRCVSAAPVSTWTAQGARGRRRSVKRFVLAASLTSLLVLASSGAALADSASISVTNTAGQSDPAAGLPRIFTVSGNVAVPTKLFVKYRGPGGAPCAPNAESDTGSYLDGQYLWNSTFYRAAVEGTFAIHEVITWSSPGPVVFCIWLAGEEKEIANPITQTITFRSPGGTITATVNPTTPTPGQRATVIVTGSSEAPAKVYAKIRSAGGASCAPAFEADSGEDLIDGESVNGSFSVQSQTAALKAGQYLLCLWLATGPAETPAIAGPQPETFSVGTPPPPPPPPPAPSCIVPHVGAAVSLRTIERRLTAAHCGLGRIRYAFSAHRRRGAVISLSSKAGTLLSSRYPVGVLVSLGRHRYRRR
jgi:hypothetical protein